MELARIQVPSGRMKALLASPREEGRRPAVIVLHEAFGLNTDMRAKAQRFADNGYVALAGPLQHARFDAVLHGAGDARNPGRARARTSRTSRRAGNGCRTPEVESARIGVLGSAWEGDCACYSRTGAVGRRRRVIWWCAGQASELEGVVRGSGFGGRDRVFGKNGAKLERTPADRRPNDIETYPKAGHSS